ncbi:MAG: hypothetical protein WAK33_11060, partial [Silvibacterium sp.]
MSSLQFGIPHTFAQLVVNPWMAVVNAGRETGFMRPALFLVSEWNPRGCSIRQYLKNSSRVLRH